MTLCYLPVMTEDETGETPRKTIRVPEDRWQRFGALCRTEGTNVTAKLNAYMQTEIDNSEGSTDA